MGRLTASRALLATGAMLLWPLHAQAAPAAPPPPSAAALLQHPSEVVLEDTKRIAFVSSVNGHAYAIDVALPEVPPPPKGYPVIYVLDGDGYFPSVAGAARMNGNAPDAVVVGVGYPRDPAWVEGVLKRHQPLPPAAAEEPPFWTAVGIEREYDLTPPADAATLAQSQLAGMKMAPEDFGGVDGFLKTIEVDVKPRVAALVHVNPNDQTIFGHSLGGLAVVEALFTEPGAFHTFVAASPSIWWADRSVLKKEGAFAAMIAAGAAAPRIIVTVGALEQTPPKVIPPEYAAHAEELKARLARARMVGNACDLVSRLQRLKGPLGYEVAPCVVFDGQAHGISVWPAIGRAIAFSRTP